MSPHPSKLLMAALLAFVSRVAIAAAPAANNAVLLSYSTTLTGSVHDFDYFMGSGWTTYQHLIKVGTDGKQDTDNFTGYLCASPYLNGTATVDELYFPTKGFRGLTLRLFNPMTHQWSIYWVSSRNDLLDASPVVGGFEGKLGLFYGTDTDAEGHPIKVRLIWRIIDHDHAHWEQAISHNNGPWYTNWTADFVRTKRSAGCTASGLPNS